MEIKTIARKWGNSMAIIIPREAVERKRIRENEELVINIQKRTLAGELFGKFPRKSGKTGQEIKDEIRKGW